MKILHKNATLDSHKEAQLFLLLHSEARTNCIYFYVVDLQFNTLYIL